MADDMELLKKKLSEFKELTFRLIGCLENDKFDDLEELFIGRQNVIFSINNLSYSQNEFISICNELQINDVQMKLEILMKEKMQNIKKEIKTVSINKNVNKSYNRSSPYADSIFLNKKL